MFKVRHEVLIAALSLAWAVTDLGYRRAIAGRHLDHHVHWLDAGDIAGQVGADAKTHIDAPVQGAVQPKRLGEIQPVGKYQRLALRVDAQSLVVGDGLFGPGQRVARVVVSDPKDIPQLHRHDLTCCSTGTIFRSISGTEILSNPKSAFDSLTRKQHSGLNDCLFPGILISTFFRPPSEITGLSATASGL